MRQDQVDALALKVRDGKGLRDSVRQAGLPVKQTMKTLRDEHLDTFKTAKAEARQTAEIAKLAIVAAQMLGY